MGPQQVCCCGPSRQEMSIECCTAGAQQQWRAARECGQCHIVSIHTKLNTDLLLKKTKVTKAEKKSINTK